MLIKISFGNHNWCWLIMHFKQIRSSKVISLWVKYTLGLEINWENIPWYYQYCIKQKLYNAERKVHIGVFNIYCKVTYLESQLLPQYIVDSMLHHDDFHVHAQNCTWKFTKWLCACKQTSRSSLAIQAI